MYFLYDFLKSLKTNTIGLKPTDDMVFSGITKSFGSWHSKTHPHPQKRRRVSLRFMIIKVN